MVKTPQGGDSVTNEEGETPPQEEEEKDKKFREGEKSFQSLCKFLKEECTLHHHPVAPKMVARFLRPSSRSIRSPSDTAHLQENDTSCRVSGARTLNWRRITGGLLHRRLNPQEAHSPKRFVRQGGSLHVAFSHMESLSAR